VSPARWCATIALFSALPVGAGAINVRVIDLKTVGEDSTTDYVAPGYKDSAAGHWQKLTGTTLALQLPDGRTAVVNCRPYHHWDDYGPSTSNTFPPKTACAVPYAPKFDAVLTGRSAKLTWSNDGKPPLQHETYRVLAILDAK
jgi:hypothetical protein